MIFRAVLWMHLSEDSFVNCAPVNVALVVAVAAAVAVVVESYEIDHAVVKVNNSMDDEGAVAVGHIDNAEEVEAEGVWKDHEIEVRGEQHLHLEVVDCLIDCDLLHVGMAAVQDADDADNIAAVLQVDEVLVLPHYDDNTVVEIDDDPEDVQDAVVDYSLLLLPH